MAMFSEKIRILESITQGFINRTQPRIQEGGTWYLSMAPQSAD